MYKNIMFDLDGTLIDSGRAVMGSVEYALSCMGYVNQPREKLRTFVGPSLFDSFIREYDMTPDQSREAVNLYRKDYAAGRVYDVDVYDGIPKLLGLLKDRSFQVIVVTSKPMHFTKLLIPHIGLDSCVDHITAPELTDTSSDKTRLINKTIDELGLKKDECIMIGDTKYDILGAVRAGIDSIGVTYGFGSREELLEAGAAYIAESVAGIGEVLM